MTDNLDHTSFSIRLYSINIKKINKIKKKSLYQVFKIQFFYAKKFQKVTLHCIFTLA